MRWTWIAGACLLAACSTTGLETEEQVPAEQTIELRKDVDPGPGPWDRPEGPPPGSIHWMPVSTKEGDTYLNGALVVDAIRRQLADGMLAVDIRLRNRTRDMIAARYVIEFFSPSQQVILGQRMTWQPFVVDGFGFVVLTNSAMIGGAAGFRLYVAQSNPQVPADADPGR